MNDNNDNPDQVTAISAQVPAALTQDDVEAQATQSRQNLVSQWTDRVKKAVDFWQPTFERMQEDMNFAVGNQWPREDLRNELGQERYMANIVPRQCSLKVAALYAKNPKVNATRRPKMQFVVWDGTQSQLMQAQAQMAQYQQQMMQYQQAMATGMAAGPGIMPVLPAMAQAVVQDYQQGMQRKKQFDKLAETLEMVFEFQMANARPGFKTQMKALVLRAITTNVGFLKVAYRRETQMLPSSSAVTETFVERLRKFIESAQTVASDATDDDSPRVSDLKIQAMELARSAENGDIQQTLREGLIFDFPPSTAVIVDPNCRCLEDFVGADWIAQRYFMTADAIQAQWNVDVRGSSAVEYSEGKPRRNEDGGMNAPGNSGRAMRRLRGEWDEQTRFCVFEIYCRSEQTRYWICDGWPDFLEEPSAPTPQVSGFWPVFCYVKNRVEVEENRPKEHATCYGESDVRLMRSQQQEKNRSREALRMHRIHNKDRYVYPDNGLSPTEMDNISSGEGGQFIPIKALTQGKPINEVVQLLPVSPIDPAVYDDSWVMQDVMLTTGTQDADLGNAPEGQTATGQSIAQASRMTSLGSDIDSLDDFLCKMAHAGGEMILTEMQQPEINRICGDGAAQLSALAADREAIKDELYLEVEAASTGKPNKTVDTQNFTMIAPQLQELWQIMGLDPTVLLKYAIQVADMKVDLDELIDEARMQEVASAPQNGKKGGEEAGKISLSVNYKDLPPELQQQTEAAMGFQPASPLSHIVNKVGHAKAATATVPRPPVLNVLKNNPLTKK